MSLTDAECRRDAEIRHFCLGDFLNQLLACFSVHGFREEYVEYGSSCVEWLDVLLMFNSLKNVPGGIYIQMGGICEIGCLIGSCSDDPLVFLLVQPGKAKGR